MNASPLFRSFAPAFGAVLLSAAAVSGQTVIANFQFNSTTDYSSSVSTDLATVSDINPAAGSGPTNAGISSMGLFYFKNDVSNQVPATLEDALTANNYIGFTVTPQDTALSFVTLAFDFSLSNATGSINPYTTTWGIFASTDGFEADNLLASGSFSVPNSSGVVWQNPSPSIDLSAVASLQAVSDAVEFRIYFWDNYSAGNSGLVTRYDNISLSAVAVPEPATYAAFFGLAALAFAAWRRRS